MRQNDAGDFDEGRGACQCQQTDAWRCARDRGLRGQVACHCVCHGNPLPLFEGLARPGAQDLPYQEVGLFERSKLPPTDVERAAAKMIASARGRDNPVALAVIAAALQISDRQVKETVEKLRLDHGLPIGARRTEPFGYFWIVDEEDAKVAAEPYRKQLVTMARVFRAVSNPMMRRELEGQIRLELRD